MNIVDLSRHKFKNDRFGLRSEIINIFLNEIPGKGKGEFTSKYNYIVMKKGDNEVYLKRPAQFNNGFDFTLNVSNFNFNPSGRATTRPTHGNILDDLTLKKHLNTGLYDEMKIQIEKIYNCLNPDKVDFYFGVGIDSEILLECIKWLFVEQDITYWNYSGRGMFYSEIQKI